MKLVALAILALSTVAAAPAQDHQRDARASAEAWLRVADAGKYDVTWERLASGVKKEIPVEGWRQIMLTTRSGAGRVTSRKFQTSRNTDTLPGAPRGSYVVVLYRSQFEKRGPGIEEVPVALDTDGRWRVCGYHVYGGPSVP